MNISFIGLGNMGLPMAKNLLEAQFNVTGSDLSQTALEQFKSYGGTVAQDQQQLVENADVIVTMLPSSESMKNFFLGSEGILKQLKPKTLIIDCSSIAASVSREVALAAESYAVDIVDAPVSGGILAAQAGTLTFMVGGSIQHFESAKPILEKMGKNIFHAGEHGAGQIAKACNNMLLAINMIGTSEALNLAIQHGLDPKVISEIIQNSSGANWCVEKYNPVPDVLENVPSSKGYVAGFMTDLMLKDLGLSMTAASEVSATVTMGELAKDIYRSHSQNGHGKTDFSSIFNLISQTS
ncbi:3-hydroxyisobutyrate dehydrogenase [Acinetobacter rongchengensis]|uniref:3-hydroxyisobutyrate dehydrogenase n=1 Tax=Acinetobacter rongchengensis TaxID=2419601 RepID=A0A3A8F1Y9_9GAMM|nr:3-hydroxyisobutyrate dehydrogenase [Acinetobacter rongchengensis]RKG40865.1 3-hydroxyisobutyrate dehydrogenase [Acinetobacter rongchengensis]